MIEKQEKLLGVRGHATPEYFKNFFRANFQANFVKFLDTNSECFTKYDAFRSHIFDYACLRRKAYRYRRGLKV